MNRNLRIAVLAGTGITVGWVALGAPLTAQQSTAPIARYEMDVSTNTGMAGMGGMGGMGGGGGGGGRMSGGDMMRMMSGGGGSEAHSVTLRLGSRNAPTAGAPQADHFPPAAARMGVSVPLVSPTPSASTPQQPGNFERPKGRLLLFWGCGPHAGPGQPVVLDFGKLAAGQMPPNLFSTNVPVDHGPSPSNSRTYGDWPNGKGGRQPDKGSSLIGEHRIAGNYSPEIKFNLGQDYLPGITGRTSDLGGGATNMTWNSVTGATGYYAWAFGGNQGGGGSTDMVWWTSSNAREFGAGLWDYLPPATVARLIGQKVVMPPSQTSCTIPAEVKAASQFLMASLYAYGPEVDFAFPPRPAKATTPWKPDWTTRVRYRSTTMFMVGGPDMSGMGGMSGNDESAGGQGNAPDPKKKKKKCGGGLGGMIGGALTGLGC